MKVSVVIPDHHGTIFGLFVKVTAEVENKLTKHLKKIGSVLKIPEDEFAFQVMHDRNVSAEDIKQEILNINV